MIHATLARQDRPTSQGRSPELHNCEAPGILAADFAHRQDPAPVHTSRQAPDDYDHEFVHLTRRELHHLTLFKWRYTLQSMGFDRWAVEELTFLTWLQATSRVLG